MNMRFVENMIALSSSSLERKSTGF